MDFKLNLWVTEKRGLKRTGQIRQLSFDHALVQFGADGPCIIKKLSALRLATSAEIQSMTGEK